MKQFKLLIVVFLSAFTMQAQEKLEKLSQSVKANKEVTLNLDTSYTNIEIDTWNRNEVKVVAYIESEELEKEELQKYLDAWNVNIEGSGSNISISTSGGLKDSWDFDFNFEFDGDAFYALKDLQFVIADMPEIPEIPKMDFVIPEIDFIMADMPRVPIFPELPELPEGVNKVDFDIEKYKEEGEPYLEKWSKEYEDKYGAEYKDKMKAWAKKFSKTNFDTYSKKMEIWGKQFGEQFGKDFEVKMEAMGKKIEKQFGPEWEVKMEAWGKKFEKQMEARTKVLKRRLEGKEVRIQERKKASVKRKEALVKRKIHLKNGSEFSKNSKIIKTIKIKIPKKTKLKVNIRHGVLKFTSIIHNLKADLSYSTLLAETIDGGNTSIKASYSPVLVSQWNLGELNLNYVDYAQLKQVKYVTLNSNSSYVFIEELTGSAMINGSFGDLEIAKISDSFSNLYVVLENSDAVIKLPRTEYNLQFSGKRTRFQHPDKKNTENTSAYSTGNLGSNKTIVIDAKYSNVVMQ